MRSEPQAVPPKIKMAGPPLIGLFAGVVMGVTAIGAGAVVFFFNPSTHGFYPACLFHQLTGLNCPGCGATRATYQLLHGHLLRALHDNALFVLSLAAMAIWSARFFFRKRQNPNAMLNVPPSFLWTFLAVAIIFTILRNQPVFSFLSP
ncbi:MAG: DUF2752 domain-containing protein [Verrucomicrobiota bacterium]|jgi:hypothetical protein